MEKTAQSEVDPSLGYHLIVVVSSYSHNLLKYVVYDQPELIHDHFYLEIVQHTNFANFFPHPTLQLLAADLLN